MADRAAAEIYGGLFERLAQQVREIWAESWCYDFSSCQMDCNEALLALGLAKETADGTIVYRTKNCEGWER